MKSLLVVLSSILMSIFLVSCSSKSALEYFNKSDVEARAFQESKKGDFIENGSPKIILWATYLNNIDGEKYNKYEHFLVSVYTSNSDVQGINELNYSFKLNEESSFYIEKINKEDKLLKLISKNNWGEYYLVMFNKNENEQQLLSLIKNNNNLINLSFSKAH